ncbi:Nesprin-2 [Camelus dromedarius]|uniref:Nesprin-2 n=1 Tax=Camelus dromedarius TaxID=9838 RepID=A0A5N4E2K1_CAMDR|nr:Nesprin-2 [Camelus dromedarius]
MTMTDTEQEDTQKKTFTCWINSQLAKHTPPSVISDLFTDIKKGHVLLDLLEVLSGQQLPRDKGSNTFQCRINIEHALTFLKNRSIKLINIHVADIIDGNPSIILGLIWTIILHFHIEELARTLSCNYNQPSPDSVSVVDSSPTSSPPAKKCSKVQERWQMSAKKALLLWAQEQCARYESVSVTDFKSSWRNGMAFLAVIHALRPDLVDMKSVRHRSNTDNLKEAFRIAEEEFKIPKMLEPEDVDVVNPDEKSIMTYGMMKDAMAWLTLQEKKLQKMLKDSESETYANKYESLLSFLESFNEEKNPFLDVLLIRRNPDELHEDQLQLKEAWDGLSYQINVWKTDLNNILPSPLNEIEAWLQEIEELLDEDLPASQDYREAMALIQEKMTLFKKFIEEKEFLAQLETSFQKCEEIHKDLAEEYPNITKQYTVVEYHFSMCRKNIYNVKSTLQKVLACWATYVENLRLLKACFEEPKKEQIKEAGEEDEKENEEFIRQLKVAEEVEKLVGQVEIWEAESTSVLDLLRHQDDVDTSVEDPLRHLIAKGSMYEELLSRTEDTLQMDVQTVSSQESLQHVLTAGLQAKIQEAKEKIQISMIKLVATLKNSTDVSPDLDVRLKVEESQKEIESYISRAEQLLSQRESHSGLISQYKEALIIFNSKSLAKYLKAVEELKNNVTEDSLHHEMSLYIQQLKVDIEKGKLSDTIAKLEKQINKEKKLIRRGRTKGLIKEHEACFSEEGSLYQLDHHMDVLRELCEELTSQKSQQEVRRALKDYEQKIERLRKCASEIHMTLQPMAMESIKDVSLESKLKPQLEESVMEKHEKDHSASVNSLLERYVTHRETLERHLQNNIARITSDFPGDKERSSVCLQDKLTDLQVLKNETDACWKEFEITSLKLEELESDIKKPSIVQARDRLKGTERELQMTLNARMESLETALQIVLPVEKESLLLCGSDLLPREMAIQEFHLTDADDIYQNLRNIQDSIAKQMEICNNLEQPGNFALKELHPLDLQATQNIILKHRTQLEEMNHRVQRSKDALKALEEFLASLRTAQCPVGLLTDLSASNSQVLPENTLTVENKEGEIYQMKDKARHLDEHLKVLGISITDAEQGEDTSCEKLLAALSKNSSETLSSGGQEELTEEDKLLETCIFKNNELLKNIQDVHNQISKIGLKDPTVPAIKQRLDKDLDECEEEKKQLQEMANSLPQFKDGREKVLSQQCQDTALLWENTKASVAECLDQCERVLELLKQYQNFKNVLTTLIQKEENVISLQASYMGKENLKKRIAEIEVVKEEFNEHLEIVDKINQICKNLQFHLNKMRTFEEPPFEKEANIIVDRWLDINEKTEDYYENLGRALALWDKLFNLKNGIDEWTEKALQKIELHQLTEEEREKLREELQVHEQKPSEFSKRVAKIQFLLQSSEIPLELQVMESSILSKIESVKMRLTGESNCCALSGSTAELREDLDQAKTQIGMTESLLNALSPSDSLEIFTKLEEIQQQILQQKHSMILLENQIGCLTPELSELKKQYESVSDLFNTKKSVLQDHFSKLLNDQCKNFNDWFGNIKMNLKECFESSETKKSMEQKLQKLTDFLTLEGRGSEIQQVGTVLNHVKKHLPKAHFKNLHSWIVSQEIELEKMESLCQARAKELDEYLQQLLRLQDDHRNLSKWLTNQEEKWKEMEGSGEKTELFCQALARKREQFESMAQLSNSVKEYGFTEEEEIVMESTRLTDRYQTLLRQICETDEEDKLHPAEVQPLHDLEHDVIHWITGIKESLMVLNSSEGRMPLEERIQKIKEIILLKPEGDAKIQTIMNQAESSKAPLVPKTFTDIKNQWDNTLHLANTYLSHQEKLLLEGEKYLQSKEDLRLMLTELKKQQEVGFALQHGLQEKKAQLKIYKKFLQKAQDLTSLLEELKSQGNYLLECTKNPNFSEEPWLEIKQLHESLLQQLQDSVQKLEGHVREHDSYQVCVTDLNTDLDNISKEFVSFPEEPVDPIAIEEKLQKLQELENSLHLQDGTLEKIIALAKSVKQNTSSVGQKIIKDDIESLKCKQKDLENRLESAKQEMENCLNSILKSKCSTEKKEKFTLPDREGQVTSDVQESTQGSAAVEKLEEDWEINKNSAVEMVLSKQLSLDVQESMKNTADEQKVKELQNQPLELDVMLRSEQLKEIEELYTQLEAKKAAIEPLEETKDLNKVETSALVPHRERHSVHHLGSLLQALTTLKKNKESQYGLLEDFQKHLAAVESSMKALLTEKESLKVGPLDSATYMDKIKKFLALIEKEKVSLSKMKIERERLSNYLTDMDKKLLESQMKQLEHDWEQVEQLVQKKYSQEVVGHDEFTFLMSKVQALEVSLQQQQRCLQLRLISPEQEGNQSMVALATELQTLKHRFSVLKGQAEFQMKRIWGEKEKKTLDDAINNLQKQVEALEPLNVEVENQIKKCETRYRMKETILWVKNLLGEVVPTISLLPDDILSQIRKCKVVHDGILDKQRVVESLVEEVKGNETLIIPKMETTSTEAELEHQHGTLTTSQKELQEIESVISTHLQEQTDVCNDLSVFERLFLDDQLKNLKARANRIQRFIQNKCDEVEHKINFYRECHEKTSMLQKAVDHIQHNELLLNPELNQDVKEELYSLKDRLTGIQSGILQVLKLKEVFDCIGLNWDWSQLDQLQTQALEKEKELEGKVKQLDTFVAERGKYQTSLGKVRAMDLQTKKRAEAVLTTPDTSPGSRQLSAQILSQRIGKVVCLYHEIIKRLSESKAFDDSFKEKEIQQIKLYAEENEKLNEVLQHIVLESQPKEMDEKNFQDKLENSFHVLNQIKSRLQQPILINLKIEHIQNEKDNCEAFQEQVQAEMLSIKAVSVFEEQRGENSSKASDVEAKLREIEDLHMQLNASIDSRTNALNDAYENMTRYNEAVSRAAGIITALEAIIASHRVDLSNPDESLEGPRWKQEELGSTIADIQDLAENLGTVCSPEAQRQLQCTLQELLSKNSAMREAAKVKEAKVERCLENYKCYQKIKEKICSNLSQMETVLGQSMSPLPVSYKEALERLEQSKALVLNLVSTKEGFMKLRQVLRHLRPMCTESDGECLLRSMSALWEKWLSLLEAAKEWEMWCEELKQEWKFVSEEVGVKIERETIILDNLQEELPEISKTKEAVTTEELSELLDCLCQHEENAEKQQLLLALLLQRIRNMQNAAESLGAVETVPASQEITSMQERCSKLFQKAQKNKELIQNEIQERRSFTKEIITLKNLLQQTTASFQNMELQDLPEKAEQLEELQNFLKKGKLTFENIMEKLRIKYSEMYTIVPAEIESQVEECRKALEDVDEKISSEVLKSSPSYAMSRKIDEINKGLHTVEKMLQQKSQNIEKAQEIQKKLWDELDLWHSKLNELDSEVQDIVEQDPGQAQEWMDNLMIPFQQYQQVSQRAESRTSQLNKATVKMEEYHDLLKSTEAWIENTSRLLADPADYDSSKTLSHHASTLQMALEDSEQKHNVLHSVFTDLEDLSIIFETDDLAQSVQELSHQVAALQQKIMESLPQIQRMADDVVAIETEVKSMEKRVSKIKAILLSKEIFDFSPEEHLKHGEIVMKQTSECDEEIEKLKQILNNYSAEFSQEHMSPDQAASLPQVQGEIEDMEKQILSLNQKKEDLLVDLKAAILNLHQHLQQEQQESETEMLAAGAPEEDGAAEREAPEWKLNRKGSMSFLPAVEEEAEESSLKSESGDKKAEPSSGSPSLLWKHDKDMEEDRASSSSGTIVQEAAGKISICDSSMAQILAPDSPNTEQGPEFSLSPNPTEEGATSPVRAEAAGFSDEQGAFEATVEKPRPGPAEVLHVCKTQVAKLELWLHQANVAFEPETLNADMQQVVEQQLVGCQAMLTEIEHKVASLLENCKDQGLGDTGATHQEAEALSLKLKTVKCNLEKVQMMLQEKYSEDQHSAILKKPSEHQKVLQADDLSEFESVVTERPPFSRQKDFQQQQVATNTSILPSVSVHNFRYPTTDELKTYTTQLEDLRQEADNLQTQENVSEETYTNLDKKLFDLFLTLSQCLGSMEEMLQTPGLFRGDVGAQQVHYETLALELKKLYLAMSDKKHDLLKAMSWPGKNPSLFLDCFDNLQVYLEHTQATAASKSKSLKAGLDYNRSYQNEIKRLYDQLIKNKTSLQQSLNEISGQSIDEQLQKADVYTVELQNYESRVAKLRDEGERLHLPYVLLQEVYKLEDVLDSTWGILRTRYTELSSPFITESQQDALLQGMVELVNVGKEKLAHDHLHQTKSKNALQAQIQNHKKLVADMLWIQTYSNKMLPSLLQKKETFWAEQVKEVKLLEEKSQQCGMKLQSLLQKWEEFDENYASLEKDLEILVSTLPSVSLVEETEERLVERISFYQQIKRNIDEKHARLYQTLNEGKQLVASVSCPELEGQIAKLEEQWLSLNRKIDHELHRLQTLLKHLLSYNKDSDQLTKWLESSQQTLNYWKEQSLNVSQDLDTIRSNINSFFEFSKELDEKSSLKTAVLSTGNQLLHLKEADTAALRASLAQFEQKWTVLITQLPDIQEKLHQLQMEKLPSRKAITEMINWMNNVEHQTADEGSEHSLSSATQVKNLLQKYKEFRMEMDYKQWIVDFVNQSLLQLSTCDVESKRYERTEFAEHLGEMNRQWHRVHGKLNRKIQHLEQLLESITENENKIQILNNWMEAQKERLNSLQKPESVISVQKMLLDCQDIENQLAIKSKALDELRESYLTLESGTMPLLEDTASRIDELFQKKTSVIHQVGELKTSMQSVLQEWKIYDKLCDEVNMMTIRLGYCMEHSKPVVLSLEALRCQVQNLQSLQDEAESSEGSWKKLQEVIGKLKDYCPTVAEIIQEKCQNTHTRWTQVNQDIAEQLQRAQSLLQLWKACNSAHAEAAARLEQQEAKYQQLANINTSGNNLAEILPPALRDIKELQHDVQKTKEAFLQNSTLLDRLPQSTESNPHVLVSGQLHSLQRTSYLEKMLLLKTNEFEFVLSQFKDFGDQLESLKGLIVHEEENLDHLYQQEKEGNPDLFLNHVLALTAQSPDIEHLNEVSLKLPLSDMAVKTLQNVNRQWIRATATALERCSELQGIGLNEKFIYCCEKWVQLLEKIEEMLKVNIADSLPALLEQQRTYEMLEAEVSINQTIADSYVIQSLQLLDTAEIEKRPEFVSKFARLKEQWQSATQGVRQRKSEVDGLVRQWQYFTTSERDLLHFLSDTGHLLSAVKCQDHHSLHQTRSLVRELQNKEIHFQRWQTTYALTLEAGGKLLNTTNLETKESIDKRISQLQDNWKDTKLQLGEMIKQFQSIAETWDQCEKKIKELKNRLQALKAQSKDPLPELHEDLHKEKELVKELEKSLAHWTQNLKELHTMKTDLTRHILVEDVMVLKEQIEHLHRQWEDLCLRVALRKQEIEDRLNSWIVFNEKNKELCAWLVQMENKVLQTADISIEEMIEKLQKDCMEEINLFTENKLQLKQMGDRLIKASNKTRAAEIDDKLHKINDRWQHLFDVIGSRVKKLKETFAFIQQLDKNMSNLRTWLARIESELSKPVVYDVCDDQEIQKRLAEQQDLQRDIEQHSAGVESVFNICDVLLHDSDACANETECDSIQQTTRSLDRRWRNICAMSMERRMKIEETWRLWQKFLEDYSRFEDWLKSAERTAAYPNSSEVLYTVAKEELKRFEAFQRQIHERLTQLELINKQYRRLARENRTDSASRLKQMVHEGNQRWDNLQKRVTAILRRLRHFTNQREEFEGTRESILVWLTEMDLQLTNVEHFSESDADDKMRQLNGFQQEITLNTNKIDQLIVFGEQLIQKSEPLDAVLIEDELEELHRYCQEGLEDEKEASENETDMEDPREIQDDSWRKRRESEEPSSPQSLCHLVPPAPGPERSGCETPVSVDSIPLEWDHTGDVGGSSSHEDDEEGPFYSALSGADGDKEDPRVLNGSPQQEDEGLAALTGQQSGAFDRWELIQAQELHSKLRLKQSLQQLNSDISDVTTWLEKTQAELETLKLAKPPSDVQDLELRVKRLKEIVKAFDTYKALLVSVNVSSKEFLQTESTDSKELQDRVGQLSLRWDAAQGAVESWRAGLRQSLMQCQDFHQLSQNLLLWLASAESRRQEAHVADPEADLQVLLAYQEELMQLEKELVERQPQVKSLQDISNSLLIRGHGEDYIEAKEKVHVIEKKLKQLLEQVSQDLLFLQQTQQLGAERITKDKNRTDSRVPGPAGPGSSRPQRSFLSRVIRAALPLQLLLLLLLLLACLLPSSEEDYSCTQANNFARSFYPMLRYTNGPPPT